MNKPNLVTGVLMVLTTIINVAVPAYVAYDVYGRGPVPEKELKLSPSPMRNLVRDLSGFGYDAKLTLTVGNTTLDNLVIAHDTLENTGRNPILPGDYYENISVSVVAPWRIVSVENSTAVNNISLNWKRISDTRFEAAPALINPGDHIYTVTYLTNT